MSNTIQIVDYIMRPPSEYNMYLAKGLRRPRGGRQVVGTYRNAVEDLAETAYQTQLFVRNERTAG